MIGWIFDLCNGVKYACVQGYYKYRGLRENRNQTSEKDYGECEPALDDSNLRDAYGLVGSNKYRIEHARLGRLFENGATTVYSYEFPYAESAMFLGHLFCDMNNHDVEDLGCIYKAVMTEPDKHGHTEYQWTSGRLIFPERLYQPFVEWLEEYKKRFDAGYDFKQLLPLIVDGQQVNGYFVNHYCGFAPRRGGEVHANDEYLYLPDDELYDEWRWVLNNCNGKVRILGDKWVFEDAGDAMMYQLQLR